MVGVIVTVGVCVGVNVDVYVGVLLGVGIGVEVPVGKSVIVLIGILVLAGTETRGAAACTVWVGSGVNAAGEQPARKTSKRPRI